MDKPVIGFDCSNITAFGWQYMPSKTDYQIVGLSGVSGPPSIYMRGSGQSTWSRFGKMADRWSFDGTKKDFMRVVTEFINAGLEE